MKLGPYLPISVMVKFNHIIFIYFQHPVSIISIDAVATRSDQLEITSQHPVAITKPVTVLSFVDSKTRTVIPSGTKIIDTLDHPGSSIGSGNHIKEVVHLDQGPPGAELQAYLQAKAMKAATVRLPSIHEDSVTTGKIYCISNFDLGFQKLEHFLPILPYINLSQRSIAALIFPF